MENLNVVFASKIVELSENSAYLELLNRVCYYDEPNGNGVRLPTNESTADIAQTLVTMPVYAKYTVDANGKPDLKDHCVQVDSNGEITFATEAIGVHTEVYIEEDTVTTFKGEVKTLPCLFAKQRIWTRNKNMVAAVKRLYEENNLHNSWEISSSEYTYKDGIKDLLVYSFLGNAFLGSKVTPAFGDSAKVLSLSNQNEGELLVAQALAKDIAESNPKEDNMEGQNTTPEVDNVVQPTVDESTIVTDESTATDETTEVTNPVDENKDTSSMTAYDLRMRITEACRNKLDRWCWVSFWFPEDHVVWCEFDGAQSELDYLMFTYSVGENDTVEVSEPSNVKLTVSVSKQNEKIAELNESIINASQKIEELQKTVNDLEPYRTAHELAEAEKIKAEHDAKVTELKNYVIDSKKFTQAEIDSQEISSLIEALDSNAIKALIADRIVTSERQQAQTVLSVKETKTHVSVPVLTTDDIDDFQEKVNALKSFLKR